jgi:L-ascorbate metabolism protein UlaG (beta-lactamase superfamily)
MEIRFLGHACFELSDGGTRVLIDPFLTGNPQGAATADEVDPSVIVLTHGHGDHLGDTVDIAKRVNCSVVAIVELAAEISGDGVEQVFDPNYGGTVTFDWGWVKYVPAWHTAVSPKGTPHMPAGVVVHLNGTTVYHLGDTCLFSDLKLAAQRGNKIDVAIMPIGGHYTMDRYDAVEAAKLVDAGTVIPCHYNTFPPIQADDAAFKSDVESQTSSKVVILQPGESHSA